LTAAPAGGKLTLPRFGEALTLRVSPRGFLKRQRGGDLRAAPTVIRPWLPKISMGLTIEQLSERLRTAMPLRL
jgi:hypothetical protein